MLLTENYREQIREGVSFVKDFSSYFRASKDGISDLKNYLSSKNYSTVAKNIETLEKKLINLDASIADLSNMIVENDRAIKDVVRNLETLREYIEEMKPAN